MVFDKKDVEKKLQQAFEQNSEHELLSILKDNSFLFYDLYDTKWGIRPNFAQVPFGSKYRSDFCWLNDNSDGPELQWHSETMAGVHRGSSLCKRWLLGTYQGAVKAKQLDYYLDEFTFRFNRRSQILGDYYSTGCLSKQCVLSR